MGTTRDTEAAALAAAGLIVSKRASGRGDTVYCVTGDTSPHRPLFRALGGRWDRRRRGWIFEGADPTARIVRRLRGARGEAPPGAGEDGARKPPRKRPHYAGHRKRLRERFMAGGGDGLPDYELLELLLFGSIPRVDVKPLAKALIGAFGSLAGVLSARPERLAEFDALSQQSIVHLKAVKAAGLRLTRARAAEGPVIGSWERLLDYCRASMAHEKIEQFRLLFLDRKNRLIADELQQTGTVDHTPVYPREVVKRALELEASAIIMVHNHPSGDPTPSQGDIEMTREVRDACVRLGIALHDHVVIARGGHASLKNLGLI